MIVGRIISIIYRIQPVGGAIDFALRTDLWGETPNETAGGSQRDLRHVTRTPAERLQPALGNGRLLAKLRIVSRSADRPNHKPAFGMTEDGLVYRLDKVTPALLGHIACIACGNAPLRPEVMRWWSDQLASDEPLATYDPVNRTMVISTTEPVEQIDALAA